MVPPTLWDVFLETLFLYAADKQICNCHVLIFLSQIADLETQLEFERNRREKLEVNLDQYKAEVARLSAELDQLTVSCQ